MTDEQSRLNEETAHRSAKDTLRFMDQHQPKDYGAAVISVTPDGKIAFHSNMSAEVIFLTFTKLTEIAVKEMTEPKVEVDPDGE